MLGGTTSLNGDGLPPLVVIYRGGRGSVGAWGSEVGVRRRQPSSTQPARQAELFPKRRRA